MVMLYDNTTYNDVSIDNSFNNYAGNIIDGILCLASLCALENRTDV